MNRSPVVMYFVPGMATDKKIFERIRFPNSKFQYKVLEWIPPKSNEPLTHYVKRMAKGIKHENPILIGVSFGGVIVQEMTKLFPIEKTIIISSVKSRNEFPRYIRFVFFTKLYNLLNDSGILIVSYLTMLVCFLKLL